MGINLVVATADTSFQKKKAQQIAPPRRHRIIISFLK